MTPGPILVALATAIVLASAAAPARAETVRPIPERSAPTLLHPEHGIFAEVELNDETGRLEVALRVGSHDLETALGKDLGRAVDLDLETDAESLLRAWIDRRFRFCRGGVALGAHWIGAELGFLESWLYFEIDVAGTTLGLSLENTLLAETEPLALHRVRLRGGDGGERELLFTARRSVQAANLPTPVASDAAAKPVSRLGPAPKPAQLAAAGASQTAASAHPRRLPFALRRLTPAAHAPVTDVAPDDVAGARPGTTPSLRVASSPDEVAAWCRSARGRTALGFARLALFLLAGTPL